MYFIVGIYRYFNGACSLEFHSSQWRSRKSDFSSCCAVYFTYRRQFYYAGSLNSFYTCIPAESFTSCIDGKFEIEYRTICLLFL